MDFTQPWDFGDVTFIVESKKIYANKAVLGMSSEVFRVMFTSDFKEQKMSAIPLPGKEFDNFLLLMQILHPVHGTYLSDNNVEGILCLAHEYQIHSVIQNCDEYLLTQPPSIHNMVLADKFSLPKTRKLCIEYMKDVPYANLEEDLEFEMIDKHILFEVFEHKLRIGKKTSKSVIYKLLTEQPSIQNFFLAEKYDLSEVHEKCLKHIKDTPLSEIKTEDGFSKLKPDTLIEVLTHKFETVQTEISEIMCWRRLDMETTCPQCNFYKGSSRDCSECKKSVCRIGDSHYLGSDRYCKACNKYRFDMIRKAMKKC